MATTVVNIHHRVDFDVYIGRPGRGRDGYFGNPIRVGHPCVICGTRHGRDNWLIQCYRVWLWRRLNADPEFRDRVRDLHGKALGCFCKRPDGGGLCHGDVLAAAADWLAGRMSADTQVTR